MTTIILWAAAVIGASSAIGKALIPVVKLTSTTKDDAILAKINALIAKVKVVFDKVGLND